MLPAGGQPLSLFTHSSTGPQGQRLRLYEDLVEPGLGAGLQVQVGLHGPASGRMPPLPPAPERDDLLRAVLVGRPRERPAQLLWTPGQPI